MLLVVEVVVVLFATIAVMFEEGEVDQSAPKQSMTSLQQGPAVSERGTQPIQEIAVG